MRNSFQGREPRRVFTRKGYAASVRQQSCQRLPRCRARHEINSNRFSAATCAPSRGASLARCGAIHLLAENSLREVETGEVPPAAETASRFRGSGTIGAPARARESCRNGVRSNCPLLADNRGTERSETFSKKWLCPFLDYKISISTGITTKHAIVESAAPCAANSSSAPYSAAATTVCVTTGIAVSTMSTS